MKSSYHRFLSAMVLALAVSLDCVAAQPSTSLFCGATPLDWSSRMAKAATERLGNVLSFGEARATLDYTNDLLAISLLSLAERNGDTSLRDYGENIVGSFVSSDGIIRQIPPKGFKLDTMPAGIVFIDIYKRTGDPRYRKAAEYMRQRLAVLPQTSDGVFSWAPNQIWLDGLFMTQPFYAKYGKEFGENADFDDITKQYQNVEKHNRDKETGLYFHGWDERREAFWANRVTGTSSSFWGRAIGWYAMSLVDVLDSFPENHPGRQYLIGLLNELATALIRFQDPKTGLWYQVVDQGTRPGNYTEASSSAIYIYTLAKGVNRGYLKTDYIPAIVTGYEGLIRNKVVKDAQGRWSLIDIVRSAGLGTPPSEWPPGTPTPSRRDTIPGGRDGSFEYYVEQPIAVDNLNGLGPFIRAGIEVDQLLAGRNATGGPVEECRFERR